MTMIHRTYKAGYGDATKIYLRELRQLKKLFQEHIDLCQVSFKDHENPNTRFIGEGYWHEILDKFDDIILKLIKEKMESENNGHSHR